MPTHFYPNPTPLPETVIYRAFSIGLDAFNRLKHWQRYMERKEGRRLTNGEVFDRLVLTIPAPPVSDTRRRRA